MDPDAEVRGRSRPAFSVKNVGSAALLGAILGVGLYVRAARLSVGDYYEDGSSHWWAAAYSQDGGRLFDPFYLNQRGYWLPGYDIVASVFMGAAGTTEPALLRSLSMGAYVAASLALTALAAPAGRTCAVLATALLAVSPFDVLNSGVSAGVEPAVALLLFGLLLQQRSRAGRPLLLWGATLAYCLATLFRYEAAPFVAILLVHGWWWQGAGLKRLAGIRERPYLVPPLLLMGTYLALTWGYNLPSQILAGPNAFIAHDEPLGLIPTTPFARAAGFWQAFVPSVGSAFALAIVGVVLHLGREEAWLVIGFSFLLTLYLFLGAGTASFRYLAPVEPLMWLLAALSVRRLAPFAATLVARTARVARRDVLPRAAAVVVGAALLGSGAQASFSTLEHARDQILLNGPLDRAAAFLAALPQDDTMLLVVDSPVAAEASGLPAWRMVGSALLPDSRPEALMWLRANVQYVLAVNLSYYKLLQLFPELSARSSDANFTLLYDATGWEFEFSVKTAWVLEVNRGFAALQVTRDVAVRFPTHAENLSAGVRGLALTYRGTEISSPTTGLGYPTLRTPLSEYVPTSLTATFAGSAASPRADLNFTLHPRAGGGGPDSAGAPAHVEASYSVTPDGLDASYRVDPPPGLSSFTLRVNHSLLSDEFPFTMNDSLRAPTLSPYGETLVWSLQNWLIGGRGTFQADYNSSAMLFAGRTPGKSAWVTYEAPEGARQVAFHLHVIAAGDALYGENEPINLKAPLFRVGGYLGAAPRNASLKVLADFAFGPYPWVLEASGLGAASFVNTTALPASRGSALLWLRANVDYVVAVNREGDPLTTLFPELLDGESNRNFSVVFDAGGGAGSLSHELAWVYLVNNGSGAVPLAHGSFLTFLFDQDGSAPTVLGLGLSAGAGQRVHPSAGIGVPQATWNGTPYRAGAASLAFTPGSKGKAVEGTYWLFPVETTGTLNRSAPPIAVAVAYAYADLLLNISANASAAPDAANLTLHLNFTLPSAGFPVYRNDTDFLNATLPVERSNIWSIRNWLTGPFLAVQVDFTDPYLLHYERTAAGESTLEYEGPAGDLSIRVSVWLLPPDIVPGA